MSTVYNFADGYNASGKSTYDIWKDAGNTGEVSDFLEFIQLGAKGERGLQGLQGPDGKSEYELWLEQEGNEGKSEDEFLNKEFETIYMRDAVNGLIYTGKIVNGKLVFESQFKTIKVLNPPTQTKYNEGDTFNPEGMVIVAVYEDGSEKEITDYTYPETVTGSEVTISYVKDGTTYTTIVTVKILTMEDILVDFTYTANDDGTYTLNTWKGTLNGEPSTEIVVPDNPKIEI